MREFNRQTGEVALPEAGEGAVVQFTVKAFEILESAYGENYIDLIVKGLAKMRTGIYQTVLAATLQKGDVSLMPFGMIYEDLNIVILDALNLAIYGRIYRDQQEIEEKEMVRRLKGLEENPQLATILSSMSAEKPASEPA